MGEPRRPQRAGGWNRQRPDDRLITGETLYVDGGYHIID
jgi:hypothetical protein